MAKQSLVKLKYHHANPTKLAYALEPEATQPYKAIIHDSPVMYCREPLNPVK